MTTRAASSKRRRAQPADAADRLAIVAAHYEAFWGPAAAEADVERRSPTGNVSTWRPRRAGRCRTTGAAGVVWWSTLLSWCGSLLS